MALIAAPGQADARNGRLPDLSGKENNAICNCLFHIAFVLESGLFSKRRDNKHAVPRAGTVPVRRSASSAPSHENKDASAKCL